MVRRVILVFAMGCGLGRAQQAIGTVGVQDATIAGALEVSNGRAVLVGNTTVTARDKTAEVELKRGGSVKVCATSGLHVTSGQSAAGVTPALMLALDRGAIEVKMAATTRDVVMTPDLRFSLKGDGPLDLQLRVTKNGDTCVENRGAQAPVLNVADPFGDGTYELRAGQHVLFEHASLKEVVDHENSSCGCPPEQPTMTVADALLSGGAPGSGDAAKTAAEAHPFPAAVSAGLAPAAVPPQAPEGALHEQVSATLSSSGGADSLAEPAAAPKADATAATTTVNAAAPSATPQKHGFGHAIGRFFKRIFGGG
ncbi:nuclease [Tunturiibacter lichenicola]|uniref:nuclease n=1 Tax=Tunturiibacter lichenicola TaxID=2051959 RepID=UPI003D9ADDE4